MATYKRGSTWTGHVRVPDQDGVLQQKTKGGFRTKKEAEAWVSDVKRDIRLGRDPFPAEDQTWATLFDRVMEQKLNDPQRPLKPLTVNRYRQIDRVHIRPSIGGLKLTSLRRRHGQAVLDGMAKAGRDTKQAAALLKLVANAAVDLELVATNPFARLTKPPRYRPRGKALTADQLRSLVAAAEGTPIAMAMTFAQALAVRRSENLAFTWDDVDWDSGRVTIRRTLQRRADGYGVVFEDVKTDAARRVVKLPGYALERLRRHRQEQNARKLAATPGTWEDTGVISDDGHGRPIHPDQFTKTFAKIAVKGGLVGVRLHDVRHSVLTELARQGVHPVNVSKIAGHASAAFTMSVYQHAWEEGMDQAAAALDAAYGTTT